MLQAIFHRATTKDNQRAKWPPGRPPVTPTLPTDSLLFTHFIYPSIHLFSYSHSAIQSISLSDSTFHVRDSNSTVQHYRRASCLDLFPENNGAFFLFLIKSRIYWQPNTSHTSTDASSWCWSRSDLSFVLFVSLGVFHFQYSVLSFQARPAASPIRRARPRGPKTLRRWIFVNLSTFVLYTPVRYCCHVLLKKLSLSLFSKFLLSALLTSSNPN